MKIAEILGIQLKRCMAFLVFGFGVMFNTYADDSELIQRATEMYQAARITCSGISDEISKVSNISKANTAVTAVGTAVSGGALAVGIKKSQEEEELEKMIDDFRSTSGCTPEKMKDMSDLDLLGCLQKMLEIKGLQQKINKSKTLGNWRTGLMAGTIGTNLASAIMSGININQSELIQHITACNEAVSGLEDVETELKRAGISPIQVPIAKNINNARTWCNKINTKDVEKIENRMKGVFGTSVVGGMIGIVGTGTSAAANSDKYMSAENKLKMDDATRKQGQALNTTANVMAGANIATGVVETGLNISLISLTKKLMQQAERCEGALK